MCRVNRGKLAHYGALVRGLQEFIFGKSRTWNMGFQSWGARLSGSGRRLF